MLTELKKEFYVVKWLEALRSGNYLQGLGSLRVETDDGHSRFCCLGVLCDIVDNSKWILLRSVRNAAVEYQSPMGLKISYPPEDIEEIYKTFIKGEDLAMMNDSDDASFAEIADVIEEAFVSKYGRRPQLPKGTS